MVPSLQRQLCYQPGLLTLYLLTPQTYSIPPAHIQLLLELMLQLSTQGYPPLKRKQTEGEGGATLTQQTEESSGCGAAVEPVSTLVATPFDTLSMALLAQQLPSMPCFSGEQMDGDGENFSEWLEWLELVANTCRWDNQAKLVNVATHLCGSASRFYRSCTPQQRSNYHALTEALRKRFTPVQIQSVQSSRFHERKQGPHESVDDYAQELQRLFHRAYAGAQSQGGGAEAMGQSVLRYQFVAGLRPELKAKVVGCGGSFEELLSKARFEEARLREVTPTRTEPRESNTQSERPRGQLPTQAPLQGGSKGQTSSNTSKTCYTCGSAGHYAREYPQKGRGLPVESRGQSVKNRTNPRGNNASRRVGDVGMLRPGQDQDRTTPKDTSDAQLPGPSQTSVKEAVQQVAATMHGIEPQKGPANSTLGPIPTSEVQLDQVPVQALLDTGSSITIVSLDFFLQAAAKNRSPGQSPAEWSKATCEQLQPSTVTLRSYGGDKLNIVSQVSCKLCRGPHAVDTVIQVQKDAPVDLLLGTDILARLGFSLVQQGGEGDAVNLLKTGDQKKEEPMATVRLLHATRLPARHSRLIRVQAPESQGADKMQLFEPETENLGQRGLDMAEGVVGVGWGGEMTLVITNYGSAPVHLEEGEVLGKLHVVQMAEKTPAAMETAEQEEESHSHVAAIQTGSGKERRKQLLEGLSLQDTGMSRGEEQQLTDLVSEFMDIFALCSSELGRTTVVKHHIDTGDHRPVRHSVVKHHIDTGDHRPVRQPPRRVPFALRDTVTKLVEEMLEQGVIVPSSSPWASPIVLVMKKDGSTRFCVDYRKLNATTKLDVFPLPRIDESLDLLSGTQYFTSLDLASGYWQVGMAPDSQEKTAFTTNTGLYEFTVMPFGLCNAPATFQWLMENVLAGLARDKCLVYLDDILVIGQTFEEHLTNLREVFSRLRRAGLKLKPTKCKLLRKEVDILGHVVSRQGIAADPKKVMAVTEFPRPTDLRALHAFLGLTSYYRCFVPCFSTVAYPLYALTRKDVPFKWTTDCEAAFVTLKTMLTRAPVLAYPQFGKGFLLETDASGVGLGAVLSQTQSDGTIRPVAFASRTLQVHEKNYGISELEALGVVWAMKHYCHYLYGHQCTVYTDYEALKSLLNMPHPSGKLARWGMTL